MISVNEAFEIIMSHTLKQEKEEVALLHGLHRVLAEDIIADRDLPPYDRVTMDGVALKFDELSDAVREFAVAETIKAGSVPTKDRQPGQVFEIMTGASLPEGTDTVVRYEDIEIKDGKCKVLVDDIKQYQNIHFRGSDTKAGDVLCQRGQQVHANIIAVAAACGYDQIRVAKQPSIAVFSSGEEIVPVSASPAPHQIRQSNVYAMSALLRSWGYGAEIFTANDEHEAVKQTLTRIIKQFDVVILTGGVSKGKFDWIPDVLDELSIQKHFHRVAQRPGKPFWFGTGEHATVFALPGNPVSTVACMVRYIQPWLSASMGCQIAFTQQVRLSGPMTFAKPLTLFAPCTITNGKDASLLATPVKFNGSGDFVSIIDADGFLELPADRDHFEEGEVMTFWAF